MKFQSLSNDQCHQAGCFLAAAEAVVHRYGVEVIDEGRRYRLRINGQLVQIFSQRAGVWQVTDFNKPFADDTTAVVLVELSTDLPDFYVVPADWLRTDIQRRHTEWLDTKPNRQRPRTPESTHFAIKHEYVEDWHRRWDVL